MSTIDDLIQRLCPAGVEFRAIGQVGEVFRGRRFVKKDYVDEGIGAIHYGELYTRYDTKASDVVTRVREDLRPNLRFVKPGDVVIAEVGETVEDVGKAVAWLGHEDVAIHDGCYGLRHDMDPVFVAYYLQTPAFHAEKNPHVARAKVKRLSLEGLKQIRIPVPPMEVQQEIVRVLDLFRALEAELEAELRAELDARRRQYAHHRDALLSFADERERERERERVRWVAMSDLVEIGTGSRNTNEAVPGGQFPFFVRSQEPLAINEAEFDEVAIITAGDGVGVGKVFHFVEGKYGLHQRAYRLRVRSNQLLPRFLFHYIRNDFGRYLATTAVHASVTSLRKPMFENYQIPLPSLEEQEDIASRLDAFDSTVVDLLSALTAELVARRRQYEHHRNLLLTFAEAA